MNKRYPADPQRSAAGPFCCRLLNVQVLRDSPQEFLPERSFIETEHHLLLLSNAHGGRLVIDGKPHVLRPGSLFVCGPGQLIEWTNFTGHPLELLLLHFHVFSPAVAERGGGGEAAVFPFLGEAAVPSAIMTGSLFATIHSGWETDAPSAKMRCEAGLLELLSLALSCQEQQTELALEIARMELERRYAGEITVDDLARAAGLSRFHFMRMFKERYGKGVMEYRAYLRLKEAKRLMNETSLTLAEIVDRIGYASESHFSNLFKKQTGFAPAVYQRNQKRKVAAYSWVNFGQLLALQTIPFAAPLDQYWTDRYRVKYGDEVKAQLSHQYDFNLNVLRQVRPDRIIGFDGLVPAEEQDKLRDIAPALFLDWTDDWRVHLTRVAEFLGQEEEARRWLSRYNRKAAAARDRLGPLSGQGALLVLIVSHSRLSVWGRRAGTVLYDDLGFRLPGSLEEVPWLETIEPSGLAAIDADRILVHTDRNPASLARWNHLSRAEAWRRLTAVRSGRVHTVCGFGCFENPWNEHSAESHSRLLDDAPGLFGIGG